MLHADGPAPDYEPLEFISGSPTRVEVWRARVSGLHTVLKRSQHPVASARLEQEARLLSKISAEALRAAGVAPLVASGRAGPWTWLAVEDVGERTLAQSWAGRRVKPEEAVEVGVAIARALACLHAHGVVHRDVKEQNIVVAQTAQGPRYWLIDLDTGRAMEGRQEITMDTRGSYARVAPELTGVARRGGPAADVYVLCRVLVEALMGSHTTPFPRDRRQRLAVLGLDAKDPRHRALVRVLAQGLALRPQRRPTAEQLATELSQLGRRDRRRRGALRLVAAGSLALGLVGVAWQWRQPAPLSFEDASEAWGIAVPSADAERLADDVVSSGFMGLPTLLGDQVLLPRTTRPWLATTPALRRDLVFDWRAGRWSLAQLSEPERETLWSQVVDLDGDGARDLLSQEISGGVVSTHIRLGPAPWGQGVSFSGAPVALPSPEGVVILRHDGQESWLTRWDGAGWSHRQIPDLKGQVVNWIDLDQDGVVELLIAGGQGTWLGRWRDDHYRQERITDRVLHPTYMSALGARLAVADLDGDGDEDAVGVEAQTGALLVFRNSAGALSLDRAEAPRVLDPGEEVLEFVNTLQLEDLDGDGLPELLLPSGGFASKGAQRAKIWRGGSLERVSLPAELEAPHDGSRFVVVDVDADGHPDLLDFSINDAAQEVPSHRAWRGRGGAPLWPLELRLPSGAPLPLGTRVMAMGARRWLHVVRDLSPLRPPSGLTGELLVLTPSGAAYGGVMEAAEGPRTLVLGGGRLDVALGEWPTSRYRAHGPGWELAFRPVPDGAELRLRRAGQADLLQHFGPLAVGLGCDDDRCRFLEQQPAGGARPLFFDPHSGQFERGTASVGMWTASSVGPQHTWVARASELVEIDPQTLAPIGGQPQMTPRRACRSLAQRGTLLACCTGDPPSLGLYDSRSLARSAVFELELRGGCDVLPLAQGWVVSEATGLLWLDDAGGTQRQYLGQSSRLLRDGDVLWAIGPARIIGLELATHAVVGGYANPSLAGRWPLPPQAQASVPLEP